MMTITVFGEPGAQGSKRHVGKGRMVESSKKVGPWREAVKHAVLKEMEGTSEDCVFKGPVAIEVTFTLNKPKSAPKRRETYPDKTPDIDKLLRSTFDALTQVGAWEDDARVIECVARKVFPAKHEDALRVPGAVIRIRSAQ